MSCIHFYFLKIQRIVIIVHSSKSACTVSIRREYPKTRHIFYILQNRRRLRRFVIPSSQAISLLGRDLREAHLQVLLGTGGFSRSNNQNSSQNNAPVNIASDPLLSSLVLNFPPPGDTDDGSKSSSTLGIDESFATKDVPTHTLKSRYYYLFFFFFLFLSFLVSCQLVLEQR